jgi:hypothetical protein
MELPSPTDVFGTGLARNTAPTNNTIVPAVNLIARETVASTAVTPMKSYSTYAPLPATPVTPSAFSTITGPIQRSSSAPERSSPTPRSGGRSSPGPVTSGQWNKLNIWECVNVRTSFNFPLRPLLCRRGLI